MYKDRYACMHAEWITRSYIRLTNVPWSTRWPVQSDPYPWYFTASSKRLTQTHPHALCFGHLEQCQANLVSAHISVSGSDLVKGGTVMPRSLSMAHEKWTALLIAQVSQKNHLSVRASGQISQYVAVFPSFFFFFNLISKSRQVVLTIFTFFCVILSRCWGSRPTIWGRLRHLKCYDGKMKGLSHDEQQRG